MTQLRRVAEQTRGNARRDKVGIPIGQLIQVPPRPELPKKSLLAKSISMSR
jgi:hypothetical protein